MRALAAIAVLMLCGCPTRPCKEGTILVSFRNADGADHLQVAVTTVAGMRSTVVDVSAGAGSVEIFFNRYPAGESVAILVTALTGTTPIASAARTISLSESCASLDLPLETVIVSADLAGADLTGADLSGVDLSGPPADLTTFPDMVSCALTAGTNAWVDPVSGVDDVTRGAGPGTCAFKTITYALTKGTKLINLAFATYSSETFPLKLMGTQGLDCDPLATGQRAVITSNLTTLGTGLVSMDGTNNVVKNCILDAQNSSGANCMVVNGLAFPPHTVANSEFRKCFNNGIITFNPGSNLNVSNSSFHDSARGIWWNSTNPTGNMSNNTFSTNSFYDIDCSDTATNVTGTGNRNGGAPPICHTCMKCTFQ